MVFNTKATKVTPRPQRFLFRRYRAEFRKLVRRLASRGPEREAAALKRASRVGLPRPVASPRRTRLGSRLRRMENFWKFSPPIIDHGTSRKCPTGGLRSRRPHFLQALFRGAFVSRRRRVSVSGGAWRPAGLARGSFPSASLLARTEKGAAPIAERRFPAPPVSWSAR